MSEMDVYSQIARALQTPAVRQSIQAQFGTVSFVSGVEFDTPETSVDELVVTMDSNLGSQTLTDLVFGLNEDAGLTNCVVEPARPGRMRTDGLMDVVFTVVPKRDAGRNTAAF